jgi:ketosteroid isomerase-like protein
MDMRKVTLGLLGIACVAALAINGFGQHSSIADDVIAMVRAQWAAEMKDPTNVAEQMKNVADDYTEFNGDYATRLEGKSLNMRLAEAGGGSSVRTVAGEMANAKVQVYNGDVAILSYNYVGLLKDKDSKTEPSRAKSTRVYVKQNGKWMLVHANFGADPVPK